MYSGISGLRNFQTKLDVIGNNIANVNTYGFKKGRTVFKDLVSQTVAGASGATETRGGINPKQVGLGSQIAAIDTLHTGGSSQFTENTLDLAITGDGFFMVQEGDEIMYTRAGNFYMDNEGQLVDSDGRFVLDIGGNLLPAIDPKAFSMSISQDGRVSIVLDGNLDEIGQMGLTKFSNPGGLEKVGGNLFRATANSGDPQQGEALVEGRGSIQSGFLEMSNVDLAEEFTEMIVAQRGFQANTRIITTSDEILQELVNLKR